jgi:hypothetical protein
MGHEDDATRPPEMITDAASAMLGGIVGWVSFRLRRRRLVAPVTG